MRRDPLSAAIGLVVGLVLGAIGFALAQPTTTPTNLQNSVNALQWTNGQGLLTGADIEALWNQVIQVFETWAAPLTSTITINGVVCTLQMSCTVSGGGGGVVTTVAGLATAYPSPTAGQGAYVTDAVSCVFGAGLTGGASAGCPVHYNGSAWTAG